MGALRSGFLGLAASLLACGCGGPAKQTVSNPEYGRAEIQGRTMHVLPVQGLEIENSDDFRENLGEGDPGPAVTDLFQRAIKKRVKRLRLAALDTVQDTVSMRDTTLSLPGGKESRFAYPEDFCSQPGAGGDLALQIQGLRFRRNIMAVPVRHPFPYGPPGMPGATIPPGGRPMMDATRKSLELDGRYLLWDCKTEEPVAYGNFSAYDTYPFRMEKESWENVVRQAARTMVESSPLKTVK